jgi:hypothetical protein
MSSKIKSFLSTELGLKELSPKFRIAFDRILKFYQHLEPTDVTEQFILVSILFLDWYFNLYEFRNLKLSVKGKKKSNSTENVPKINEIGNSKITLH